MARLRNPNPGAPEVRAAMAEFLSFIIEAYKPPHSGWRRQLQLLEAGEAVTVQVWELPDDAPYPAHLEPGEYVTVHGDGSITEAT